MSKKITFLALLLMAGVTLSACGGPSAKQGVVQGSKQKDGFMGLSTADEIKVTTAGAFKDTNRVVIGGFTVGFATYKTDSAKAGGGLTGNGFGGKSTAKSTLEGIDAATMQSITDKAYADFVADLKKQGVEVVDRSTVFNGSNDLASTKTTQSPYEDSTGGLFGKKSLTTYVAPSSFGGIRTFLGDIPGTTGMFGGGSMNGAAAKFAESSGTKVISVVYILDFANADSYGSYWSMSSNVTVGQGVTIVPNYSKLTLVGGQPGTFSMKQGSLVIGQPITSTHEFASVTDATSGASRATEIAANVVGVLGGVGTNAKRDFVFKARPADYNKAATESLSTANTKLAGTIGSLR